MVRPVALCFPVARLVHAAMAVAAYVVAVIAATLATA